MAHAWKACWVHALAGSNPASSAPLNSQNAGQPARADPAFWRLVAVVVAIALLLGLSALAVAALRSRADQWCPEQPSHLVRDGPPHGGDDVLVRADGPLADAECRASCRRRSGTPASSGSRFHSAPSACGLSGRPVGVVNT